MTQFLKKYAGIIFNAGAGYYLYVTPVLDPALKWILIIGIVLSAVITILSLGTIGMGWAFMMRDTEATDGYEPGGDRAIQMYEVTVDMLSGYTRKQFYVSFASSIGLMAGIMMQGWTILLALEVLGSAIGYGFISWVWSNIHRLHERAHGTTE